jgi:hypothetical protein
MQWVDMRTGTAEGTEPALADCRAKAWDEAWRGQWLYGWPPPFYEPHPRYPGWRRPFWVGRQFTVALRHRLEDFCMRSKGFRLVEVRKD